jgi:hypothetical protein
MGQGLSGSSKPIIASNSREQSRIQADPVFGPYAIVNRLDRLFWTTLRRFWPRWSDVLVIVKPETVICDHVLAGDRTDTETNQRADSAALEWSD